MAVIYFTNNADSGAGSLRATIASAQPGDVVRPDETVFECGSTIEIVLASTLSVGKNLTLDGGPFRIRLNGGGAIRCASVAANVTATFIGVDFVAGYNAGVGGGINAPGTTDVTFERCGFYGCKSNLGGGACTTGTTRYNDCAFLGCAATESGGAVYASKETTLNGVTAAGCVAANKGDSLHIVNGTAAVNAILCGSVGNPNFLTATGSVVGVASSSVGFVASPPDDLSVENWDANAWQSWNLRLFDDASGAPSPYRDSGDVDAASKYDLDGNFRGRETNGVATCSPGAYETIQADLFWIGVDANGAEVVSPAFLTSDGWATSRFASASGDAAPQTGQTFFVDGSVDFVDVLPTSNVNGQRVGLTLGGGANVRFPSATVYWFDLQTGADSTFTFATVRPNEARFGDRSRLDGTFAALPKYDVGSQVYIRSALLYSYARLETTYDVLTVYAQNSQALRLGGAYRCDEFRLYASVATSDVCAATAPGTTVRARVVKWGSAFSTNAERLASEPITLILQDGASLVLPDGAPESWADHFVVDASEATSATLTLNGQTVYGDATKVAVELSGSAKIDERGLDVASLTLNDGAMLTVDGGIVCVGNVDFGAARIKDFGDLVFALGGTVTFSPETTVNGVPISDYDAATNDVRITFETSELVWESRVSGSNVEITDPLLADDRFVFRFDRYANGEFVEFYATDSRVSDANAPAYETTSNWNGAASPTLVDASAEPGWNYYRVRLDEPIEKGGVLLNAYASPTRYVAVWVGNDEPTRTYYYRGGAKGSFIEPGDWTLTSDGLVPCVEKPTQAGATFYVGGSFEVVES